MTKSRQQFLHHVSVNIREPEVPARMAESKLGMIEPKQLQKRRVQVMNMDGIFRRFEAELVGGAVNITAADSSACQPHCEAMMIMIAPINLSGVRARSRQFDGWC